MLIQYPAFESTEGGIQFYKSGRRASSEFCTVQVLLGLGKLSALWNTEGSAFQGFDCTQTLVNTFGAKRNVRIIVGGRFSGVSVRQGSTVYT